jgi:ATP-binding cassette subfamily F protein uup
VVVSHDRYFVERVCDDVFALEEDGGIRHLPGGIEQYLELWRRRSVSGSGTPGSSTPSAGAARRAASKEIQRLERALDRHAERETALHEQMSQSASDHARLSELTAALQALVAERERLETAWLETAAALEA